MIDKSLSKDNLIMFGLSWLCNTSNHTCLMVVLHLEIINDLVLVTSS